MNRGPYAMRLAQQLWKQDQAIRLTGGRAMFQDWPTTLKAAWAQVKAVGAVAASRLDGVLRLAVGGFIRPAAILAAAILKDCTIPITTEMRIRLVGLVHKFKTGVHNPRRYH